MMIKSRQSLFLWLLLLSIPLLAYGGIRLFKATKTPPPLVFLLAEDYIGPVFFFFDQADGVNLKSDPLGQAVWVSPNGVVKIKAPVDDVMGSSSEKHRATYMVSVGQDGRRKILKMFVSAHKKEDGAWWWGYFDEKTQLHEFQATGEWTGFSFVPANLQQDRMVFGNEGCRNQGFSPRFAEFAAGTITAEQAGIPVCGKFPVASPAEYSKLPDWMWKDLQHPYPSIQAFVDEANERLKRQKEISARPSSFNVHIGEQGEEFLKKYPDQVNINRQPAGLDFYNVDWKTSAPGKVVVENGKYSFTVANALSVLGTKDLDLPEEGISEFSINAGISASELMGHDEARLKLFSIFECLLQAGWKVDILRSHPRLRGRDMLSYILNGKRYGTLDAAYLPTLEEWMRIENSMSWDFYSDNAFLTVYFLRDQNLMDPGKPGAYLLVYDIQSEAEYFRSYVAPKDRKQWKEFLPAELSKLPPMRAAAETEMRAQGLKIDETYQDPPPPDFIKSR